MTKRTIKALLLGGCLVALLLQAHLRRAALGRAETTLSSTPYPYNIYFGDLHVHTSEEHRADDFAEEFSREVVEEANRHARDDVGHDFIAVTNHDYLLQDWMWEVHKEVADEFDEAGVFVSLPAYEWTASRFCGVHMEPKRFDYPDWGHRNIYYRSISEASLFRCNDYDYDTPDELIAALPDPNVVTTVPHHTSDPIHPFAWTTINPSYDRLVEIIQGRGSFEDDVVQNGWDMARTLGVVGGSDGHDGLAGAYEGITAILAPTLTRDALFDALISRRTYATTHGDVLLHFFGDGEMQGANLSLRDSVLFSGDISGRYGDDISLVEFLENGIVVDSWIPNQPSLQFEKTEQLPRCSGWNYFYVRVTLENGHQAWSSPIWAKHYCHFFPFAARDSSAQTTYREFGDTYQ